ncbi:Hypothetical predicted protein, partial [Pelobates cultripes]
ILITLSAPPAQKKLSGAAFRKKRRLQEEDTSKMAGSLNRFFKPDSVQKVVNEMECKSNENRKTVDVEQHPSTSPMGEQSLGIESDTNTEEESSQKSASSSEDENGK